MLFSRPRKAWPDNCKHLKHAWAAVGSPLPRSVLCLSEGRREETLIRLCSAASPVFQCNHLLILANLSRSYTVLFFKALYLPWQLPDNLLRCMLRCIEQHMYL